MSFSKSIRNHINISESQAEAIFLVIKNINLKAEPLNNKTIVELFRKELLKLGVDIKQSAAYDILSKVMGLKNYNIALSKQVEFSNLFKNDSDIFEEENNESGDILLFLGIEDTCPNLKKMGWVFEVSSKHFNKVIGLIHTEMNARINNKKDLSGIYVYTHEENLTEFRKDLNFQEIEKLGRHYKIYIVFPSSKSTKEDIPKDIQPTTRVVFKASNQQPEIQAQSKNSFNCVYLTKQKLRFLK